MNFVWISSDFRLQKKSRKNKPKMVYETEYYRRPYSSRPTISSYTVTVSARIPFSGVKTFFPLDKWWEKLVLCVGLNHRKSDFCEVELMNENGKFMKITLTSLGCVNSFEKEKLWIAETWKFPFKLKIFVYKEILLLALLLLPEPLTQTIHILNLEPLIDGYKWRSLKVSESNGRRKFLSVLIFCRGK